jgi:hypothetical protein
MGNKQSSNESSNKIDTYEQQNKTQLLFSHFIHQIKNMETFTEEEIKTMNEMSEEDRMKFFLAYNEIVEYIKHIMSHDILDAHP